MISSRHRVPAYVLVASIAAAFTSVGLAQLAPGPQTQQTGSPVVTVPGSVAAPNEDVPSQQAVAVKEVESPATPTHYDSQAIWALAVSMLIQYLKKRPWFGWITPSSSARLKTQFGFVMALLTTAGIHFAVSGSIFEGGGASITISGLTFNSMKDVVWQWAAQQGWYRLVVKEPKEIALVAGTLLDTTVSGKDELS